MHTPLWFLGLWVLCGLAAFLWTSIQFYFADEITVESDQLGEISSKGRIIQVTNFFISIIGGPVYLGALVFWALRDLYKYVKNGKNETED